MSNAEQIKVAAERLLEIVASENDSVNTREAEQLKNLICEKLDSMRLDFLALAADIT